MSVALLQESCLFNGNNKVQTGSAFVVLEYSSALLQEPMQCISGMDQANFLVPSPELVEPLVQKLQLGGVSRFVVAVAHSEPDANSKSRANILLNTRKAVVKAGGVLASYTSEHTATTDYRISGIPCNWSLNNTISCGEDVIQQCTPVFRAWFSRVHEGLRFRLPLLRAGWASKRQMQRFWTLLLEKSLQSTSVDEALQSDSAYDLMLLNCMKLFSYNQLRPQRLTCDSLINNITLSLSNLVIWRPLNNISELDVWTTNANLQLPS